MARSSRLLATLLVSALVHPLPARAAQLLLDGMQSPFPTSDCLPVSAQRIVFCGAVCDAAACPPGDVVSGFCPTSQPGLNTPFGVVTRNARVIAEECEGSLTGEIDTDLGAMVIRSEGPFPAVGGVEYRRPDLDWDLDLPAAQVTAIRVRVGGDVSITRPIHLTVLLTSDFSGGGAHVSRVVTYPQIAVLALGEFTPFGDFDFTDVETIRVDLSECEHEPCTGPFGAREMRLGPIWMADDLVNRPAVASFGALKTRYR